MTEPTSTPTSADLSVKFQEPTVAGLTGEQWSRFRRWEAERRCDFEDELCGQCPDDKVRGSNFCNFHKRLEDELNLIEHDPSIRDNHEPYYDEYDIWRDNPYEVDE